jgi:putative transposase
MKEWQSQAHVKWECKYYVVILPKYRKKVLYGRLRGKIGGIFRELCCQKDIELVEGNQQRLPGGGLLEDPHPQLSI